MSVPIRWQTAVTYILLIAFAVFAGADPSTEMSGLSLGFVVGVAAIPAFVLPWIADRAVKRYFPNRNPASA